MEQQPPERQHVPALADGASPKPTRPKAFQITPPREVFRAAIVAGAAAVILAHQHPSGDPTPSSADRDITEQLAAAGRLLDIPVHDHVIIGAGRYASFAEAGLL